MKTLESLDRSSQLKANVADVSSQMDQIIREIRQVLEPKTEISGQTSPPSTGEPKLY